MIRLFVGLGNPGAEYEGTRHNAGFAYIDELAKLLKVKLVMERRFFGFTGRIQLPNGPVWLLQPQTFMNLSGKSVAALAGFFKINHHEILVAHDELDIAAGQIKIKHGGGHAGHNGLRDIHAQLGSPDYWRLRLGIGHPGEKSDVTTYVLRQPPANERILMEQSINKVLAATNALLDGDMPKATHLVHAGVPRAKPLRTIPAPLAKPQEKSNDSQSGESAD